MNPEEENKYLPCNSCLEDSEHYVNVWDEWECVICGDVLDEDTPYDARSATRLYLRTIFRGCSPKTRRDGAAGSVNLC